MSDSDSAPVPTPSSEPAGPTRRGLAGIAAAVAAAPIIGLVPDLDGAAATAASGAPGRLQLRRDPGSVVSALDVPLVDARTARPGLAGGRVRTAVLHTTEFSTLGVTWRSGKGEVRARTRRIDGTWSGWEVLPLLRDHPDPDSLEGRRTPRATEPVWVGRCDAVQLEVAATQVRPTLALIDPGSRSEDHRNAGARRTASRSGTDSGDPETEMDGKDSSKAKRPPRPKIHYRKDWGPNTKLLNGDPGTIKTVKQVHVHHTVNANDYKKSDVPKLIRAMYRYHTKTLGWADIGYNFLVDRFGRIWVGRRHSCRMAQGAHTLGFNHCSVGISVIGNFESGKPNKLVVKAIARVASWKLAEFDRDPLGRIKVTSHGSDKFSSGQRVRLPVIDGHRDTNDTACPGRHLYRRLPKIRERTAKRIGRYVA